MKDVAREVGVSAATVSYVLNGLGKVSPEVEAKVREAAKRLGYARNSAATALRTGRHNVIGCIVPTLLAPVFPEIMRAIHERARERGCAIFMVETGLENGGVAQAAQVLASHGVDGAIALLETRPELTDPPLFPLVVLDRTLDGFDSVLCDHYHGGQLMAEHALALGHRRIGLLAGSESLQSSHARRDGLLDGLKGRAEVAWEVDVPLRPELPAQAREALGRREASFVACVNDTVAMGAMNALRSLEISVPDEVSVMGFDDMSWSSWPILNLSTIHQPLEELGSRAVDLLIRRVAEPLSAPESVILPVALKVRGSTRAVVA